MTDKQNAVNDSFEPGRVLWSQGLMNASKLLKEYLKSTTWDDGFIAFSSEEKRLKDFDKDWDNWLKNKNSAENGYLMEAGLWRKDDSTVEELAIEREGENFFVQHWRLDTSDSDNAGMKCYFREARTFKRGNIKIFDGTVRSVEVIIPDFRLRLYLTKGGES